MGLFDTLRAVVTALDLAGIAHMVSGSVASARHGESRTTQDIDIVIDPDREQMSVFLHAMAATDLYVGDGMAALEHRSQFNVVDAASGWLEWSLESGSERQRRDVRSLLAARGSTLDWTYLRRWAAELGVGELLEAVAVEAEQAR